MIFFIVYADAFSWISVEIFHSTSHLYIYMQNGGEWLSSCSSKLCREHVQPRSQHDIRVSLHCSIIDHYFSKYKNIRIENIKPWNPAIQTDVCTVFDEINAHLEISAHQKQWVFKGGEYIKPMGFGGWFFKGGSTQNRWALTVFGIFFIASENWAPGVFISANTVNDLNRA